MGECAAQESLGIFGLKVCGLRSALFINCQNNLVCSSDSHVAILPNPCRALEPVFCNIAPGIDLVKNLHCIGVVVTQTFGVVGHHLVKAEIIRHRICREKETAEFIRAVKFCTVVRKCIQELVAGNKAQEHQ